MATSSQQEEAQCAPELQPYKQSCEVGFAGHTEVGPPKVPSADSFVQYTFTIRTEATGTLEFSERFSKMHQRHQQLKRQMALVHYDPPLDFPGKGAVMPWWPGAEKRIAERGEKLADYYQRLVSEATLATLEVLGTCWGPGYTLHGAVTAPPEPEPEPELWLNADGVPISGGPEDGDAPPRGMGTEEAEAEAEAAEEEEEEEEEEEDEDQAGSADPTGSRQSLGELPAKGAAASGAAFWWVGVVVVLVAVMVSGAPAAGLGPELPGLPRWLHGTEHPMPGRSLPPDSQLDAMRSTLNAAEASRSSDAASVIDPAAAAEVERAQRLKAALEVRRAKLSAAEEEQRSLEQADKEREKQRAAYEATMLRRRGSGSRHTAQQQQQQQDETEAQGIGKGEAEAAADEAHAITTKNGCTCLPLTIDRSDPTTPVEWKGCA
jgi:hypothetical protein